METKIKRKMRVLKDRAIIDDVRFFEKEFLFNHPTDGKQVGWVQDWIPSKKLVKVRNEWIDPEKLQIIEYFDRMNRNKRNAIMLQDIYESGMRLHEYR